MADIAELFPGLVDQLAPRPEYAARPIGSRRYARPHTRRGPSTASRLVAQVQALTHTVETLSALLIDTGAALEQVAAELRITAQERRRINEKLDLLLRSQTETRRALGQTAMHVPPRHTRRQPLGHD